MTYLLKTGNYHKLKNRITSLEAALKNLQHAETRKANQKESTVQFEITRVLFWCVYVNFVMQDITNWRKVHFISRNLPGETITYRGEIQLYG